MAASICTSGALVSITPHNQPLKPHPPTSMSLSSSPYTPIFYLRLGLGALLSAGTSALSGLNCFRPLLPRNHHPRPLHPHRPPVRRLLPPRPRPPHVRPPPPRAQAAHPAAPRPRRPRRAAAHRAPPPGPHPPASLMGLPYELRVMILAHVLPATDVRARLLAAHDDTALNPSEGCCSCADSCTTSWRTARPRRTAAWC